jgi:periplasmic divalent cation tolerance protein
MDDLVILYTTWPDAETAETVARAAVDARLAACANILGPMRSIYRWDGAVQAGTETAMLLKTPASAAERLMAFVRERHPYNTPCIVGLAALPAASNPAFLAWARQEVG